MSLKTVAESRIIFEVLRQNVPKEMQKLLGFWPVFLKYYTIKSVDTKTIP